jgi:hypothetical protein
METTKRVLFLNLRTLKFHYMNDVLSERKLLGVNWRPAYNYFSTDEVLYMSIPHQYATRQEKLILAKTLLHYKKDEQQAYSDAFLKADANLTNAKGCTKLAQNLVDKLVR